MVKKEYVLHTINKLKYGLKLEIQKKDYEIALELISNCAYIIYQTNLYYVDEDLEENLKKVSKDLNLSISSDCNNDVVFFYDGFGLNNRGLAQIYLKALCQLKKVVYITYEDCQSQIPDILNILKEYDGTVLFINRKGSKFISQIQQLSKFINQIEPNKFFFYSFPNDVVGTVILNAMENKITRYQVNLTDHAFWLGARCIDKCIEFRDYGASISARYRKIPKEKIDKLPFYPVIHKDKQFQGFPFKFDEKQKLIFSGGALYKTLGADNKYYEIVDHILSEYNDAIFWYAGSGDDTELKKILKKYPERAFYTSERSDLFQVLQHCRVYLSTYPICGGLMYQYAACAGVVPVTLRYDEDADGYLLEQDKLKVEFNDVKELYSEIDRLLCDDLYFYERKKQMLCAVMTEDNFSKNLKMLLDGKNKKEIKYSDINTKEFRKEYLMQLTSIDIDSFIFNRNTMKSAIKYTPIQFVRGGVKKIMRKVHMFF